MRIKKFFIILLLALVSLVSVWQGVEAIETIPKDKQVSIILTRPNYNVDGTPCLDLAGYYIYRSTTQGGPYTRINNVLLPAAQTTYVDQNLINNVDYYYVASSVDDVGNVGPKSGEKQARPTGDEEKPSSITDLTISSENGAVSLNWSFASDNDAVDRYEIYRELSEIKDIYLAHKNTPAQIEPIATVDSETNAFTDVSVKAGTVYYYVVTAFDASGNEADSSNSVSILVQGQDTTPPYLTSVDEDTGGVPQKGGSLINLIVIGESDCTATVTLDGLTQAMTMSQTAQPGTYIYTYTAPMDIDVSDVAVIAEIRDAASNKTSKTSETKIAIDNTPPKAVADLTVTADEANLVRILWNGGGDDTHHYTLYRYQQPITAENKNLATVLKDDIPLGSENYLDDTVAAGMNVYYAVGSLDLAGNETLVNSDLLSVAPDTEPPEIILVTEDTMGATRKTGDLIEITIIGEPALTAACSIEGLVSDLPMDEEMLGDHPSGTYTGIYEVKSGDSALDAVITGRLVDKAGLTAEKEAAGRISIVTNSSDIIPPVITYVDHDAAGILVAGDVLEVTVEGEAGGAAYADLGAMQKAVLLNEITDGTYSGTYTVARGDNLSEAVLIAHLVDKNGNEAIEQAAIPININTNLVVTMTRGDKFLVADGQSSTQITATLKNAKGEPVSGERVDFTLAGGDGRITSSSGRTGSSGSVSATYEVGEIVMTAFICAEAVGTGDVGVTYVLTQKSISIDILLTAGNANQKTTNSGGYAIEVFAKPHRITADGHSVSVVTALVTLNGEPVEGVRVSFDITKGVHGNEGSLDVLRAYTDANGEAEAVYTAGTQTQLVLITATAFVPGDSVSEQTQILLIAGGVKFLFIEAAEMELVADGSSSTVVMVRAEDEFNNRAPDIRVEFSLTKNLGTLSAPYSMTSKSEYDYAQGDAIPAVGGGEATVTFTAGDSVGTETITALVTSQTWGGAGDFFQEGLDIFTSDVYDDPYDMYSAAIPKFNTALEIGREENLGFTTDYTEENWTDDVLYMRGYSYEMTNDYLNAILSFEEVVGYYFGGTWADNAQYRIGQCYEKDGSIAKAIESYQEVIDEYRAVDFDTRNLKDNAQFRLGRCYEKSGYLIPARNAYKRLLDLYPDSDLYDDAQAAINRLNQN